MLKSDKKYGVIYLGKGYFKRVLSMTTKAELVFWWILRLIMVGGMIFTLVKYFSGDMGPDGFNPQLKFDTATGVYKLDPYNALQMAANLVGMFAFEICQCFPEKTFPRYLPAYFQNITIIGFFLASFGGAFLNFYYLIPAYDKILHLTGCMEAVFMGYELVSAMQLRDRQYCSGKLAALCAFGIAFIFAAGWELFEFTTDQWFGFDAQHWSIDNAIAEAGGIENVFMLLPLDHFGERERELRFAIMDTMGDAILNALGAIPMYLFLRKRPYHHMGEKNINKIIEEELANNDKKEVVAK